MQGGDFAAFSEVIADLCAAYDRPATDARNRVFWETLKPYHLHDIKRAVAKWRDTQRKMPAPVDLKPQRSTAPPKEPELGPGMSTWAVAANTILFAVAYLDVCRGFVPVSQWEQAPEKGWGLPLPLAQLVDGSRLKHVLAAKADYVRMAEEAEKAGEAWDTHEFNVMCRQGFEQLLGTKAAA